MADPIVQAADRRTELEADAGQTVFQFDFPGVNEAGDIRFYANGELVTAFTLDAPSKTVTLASGLEDGDIVVIEGLQTIQRDYEYPRGGEMQTRRLNPEMNFFYMVLQELRRDVNRAITFSKDQIGASPILPLMSVPGLLLVTGADGIEISAINVNDMEATMQALEALVEEAQGYADAAQGHADTAAQGVAAIAGMLVQAEDARDDAEDAVDDAEQARDDARLWAVQAEDVPVDDGVNPSGYSAHHWALKAQEAAGGGIALTGDVTGSGAGSVTTTIANKAVGNAKMADMAAATFKMRAAGAGTGVPIDGTATQATAALNAMTGDTGTGGVKGLVPAPAAGDAAAGKFLKADATWAAVAAGGRILKQSRFTASGTFVPQPGTTSVLVISQGDGGNGSTAGAGYVNVGGGGGQGGYSSKIFTIASISNFAYTKSSGGFSFSGIATTGGASSSGSATGAAGGTATGGDVNIPGAAGGSAPSLGGVSISSQTFALRVGGIGGGGVPAPTTFAYGSTLAGAAGGTPGQDPGDGGSGAVSDVSVGSVVSGGAGKAGYIEFWEFG